MRIVYLHQYFNTPQMVGGTRSYEMARRLVAMGHEVHIITSWREESDRYDWYSEIIEGINVHWLPVRYENKMGFIDRLRAFFKFAFCSAVKAVKFKADLVFATSTPLTIAIPGIVASRWMRVPLVFEVRDLWPEVPIAIGVLRNPLLKLAAQWLEKFAYINSSRIIALAPGMADSIVNLGIDSSRISIIPNGCDLNLFEAKNDLIGNSECVVLYIGTIGLANGVEYIPRLAAAIRQRHPDSPIRFIIIGDGKNLEQVKVLSVNLGLDESQITFLGALPKENIPGWLEKCRMTIMTYDGPEVLYRDSVSNKFFDSLAARRPIVANFSGFSTLVAQAASAGVIISRDNINFAADTLVKIINDNDFFENGRRVCDLLARETFDRDRLALMLEEVLIQAAKRVNPIDCSPVGGEFRELWDKSKSIFL